MRRVDRLVAGPEIAARRRAQQFVGTRAADDAAGVEAVTAGDGVAQQRRLAVRIAFELGGGRL